MIKIVTGSQMQALDRRAIIEGHIPGTTLMEKAGAEVVASLAHTWGNPRGRTITVFCGKGNNGGDGFVVARLLHRHRAKVKVLAMAPVSDMTRDAATMYRQFVRTAGKSCVSRFTSKLQVQPLLQDSDFVVDALFGTGLSADITGPHAEAIDAINEARPPVASIDLPSGLHADTGRMLGRAVQATLTITLALPKVGLYLNDESVALHDCLRAGMSPHLNGLELRVVTKVFERMGNLVNDIPCDQSGLSSDRRRQIARVAMEIGGRTGGFP